MYANTKENVDVQIAGTAIGFLNVFVFVGGAIYQQVMASIIARYPTVGGVIPVAAFKSAFLFCFVTLIIGLIVFATQKEKPAA